MPLHPNDIENRKEACVKAIQSLALVLGRTPSEKDYKLHFHTLEGAPTPSQLRYVFSSWTTAVLASGLQPLPTDPPKQPKLTDEVLIDEFVRVANDLGQLPGLEIFRQRSAYSNRPYDRWGKWSDVQAYFITNHCERFTFKPEVRQKREQTLRQNSLGIDCPLVYEPRNEFETIALFTLLAKDLGYRILRIQGPFPDGLLEKDGDEIVTEFEFMSSNYLSHCHPRSSEYLCICWRNDCDISPVRVMSLEEIVRDRKLSLIRPTQKGDHDQKSVSELQ